MKRFALALTALALVVAACGGDDEGAPPPTSTGTTATAPTPSTDGTSSSTTSAPATTQTAPPTSVAREDVAIPVHLQSSVSQWGTDWELRTIDLDTLRVGIVAADPRDRIAPLDGPGFESTEEAASWLADREPGVLLVEGEVARFYPLQILTLHEIANDRIDGRPVAVTYCPLCNTAIVFDREIEGVTHRFGVSGLLRNSDLVMWDDVTESLWQQITGEAIVGTYAGRTLEVVPSTLVRFGDARADHPDLEVLSQDTGFPFPYGVNPYEGYSSSAQPFAFDGEVDPRYPALERVVGVTIGDSSKAYPFPEIREVGAVDDTVGGIPITVWWGAEDTADALDDATVAEGEGVGSGVAYLREVGDRVLSFERVDDSTFRDLETGSTWNILGTATDGPLAGERLTVATHRNEFWFAWTAFFPDAPVYEA